MTERDLFIREFKALLATLPNEFDKFQAAYRQVVVAFGAAMLDKFPEAFTGPEHGNHSAFNLQGGGPNPGLQPLVAGGPGIRPSTICQLGCLLDKS